MRTIYLWVDEEGHPTSTAHHHKEQFQLVREPEGRLGIILYENGWPIELHDDLPAHLTAV